MPKETQISAIISQTTRERLEKHVRASGLKKGHLVEQALLHHLQALEELPADVIVHPRIVVTRQSFEKVLEQMEKAQPTQALRELMRDGD
jgi:tRNA pseudouridine-54 N-methylase